MPKPVRIYTTSYCTFCRRAKELLRRRGIPFEDLDVTDDEATRRWLVEATGRRTVPQIFIGEEAVGGYEELRALDETGRSPRRSPAEFRRSRARYANANRGVPAPARGHRDIAMRALCAVLLLAAAVAAAAAAAAEGEEDPWAKILAARVNESGEVAYRTLAREDGRLLRRALDRMASVDLAALDHDGAVAFWINAYHATLVAAVVHGETPESLAGRARMYHWFGVKVGGSHHRSTRSVRSSTATAAGIRACTSRSRTARAAARDSSPRRMCRTTSTRSSLPPRADSSTTWTTTTSIRSISASSFPGCSPGTWPTSRRPAGTLVKFLRPLAERRDLVAALAPENVEIRYLPFDWRLNAAPGERIQ